MMVAHIRYAGSKLALADQVTARFGTDIDAYFEGFAGTGVIYLTAEEAGRFKPGSARWLCEYSRGPYEVLDGMRDSAKFADAYSRALSDLELEGEEAYMSARKAFELGKHDLTDLLMLRIGAFQGLWRTSQSGKMNVPYRRSATGATGISTESLRTAARAMSAARVLHADFEAEAVAWEATTTGRRVAYFDPPYFKTFSGYTPQGFKDRDHERLIRLCAKLTDAGVHVLLSNSDDPVLRRMIETFWPKSQRHEIDVYRRVSAKVETRGWTTESLFESAI